MPEDNGKQVPGLNDRKIIQAIAESGPDIGSCTIEL